MSGISRQERRDEFASRDQILIDVKLNYGTGEMNQSLSDDGLFLAVVEALVDEGHELHERDLVRLREIKESLADGGKILPDDTVGKLNRILRDTEKCTNDCDEVPDKKSA